MLEPLPHDHLAATAERSARPVRDVVVSSVAITAGALVFGVLVAAVSDVRWNYAFVMTRWMLVFALLALPVVDQVVRRRGGSALPLPWALRTPATALLLTAEGIVYDIASANLG